MSWRVSPRSSSSRRWSLPIAEAFEREIEAVPEMTAMLEAWSARVADQVIVYAEEIEAGKPA